MQCRFLDDGLMPAPTRGWRQPVHALVEPGEKLLPLLDDLIINMPIGRPMLVRTQFAYDFIFPTKRTPISAKKRSEQPTWK